MKSAMIYKIIALLNVTKYLRPAEVDTLKGDFSKARKIYGDLNTILNH